MDENYYKKLEELKTYYFQIGPIYCPATDCDVTFNEQGFRHFLRKSSGVRPTKDQLRRFRLFNYVTEILNSSTTETIDSFTNSRGISFCSLTDKPTYPKVKVILRKVQSGTWHYYSVMNHKQK